MARKSIHSAVQLSLFPKEETSVKDNVNARFDRLQVIKSYLHTREGLWRMLTCMPPDMPVAEALAEAPARIFGYRAPSIAQEKGGCL